MYISQRKQRFKDKYEFWLGIQVNNRLKTWICNSVTKIGYFWSIFGNFNETKSGNTGRNSHIKLLTQLLRSRIHLLWLLVSVILIWLNWWLTSTVHRWRYGFCIESFSWLIVFDIPMGIFLKWAKRMNQNCMYRFGAL